MAEDSKITVRARQCPYDPTPLIGVPLGMFHCEVCGCMVVAGIPHGVCLPNLCPLLDSQGNDANPDDKHPGEPFDYELEIEAAQYLGLTGEERP